MYLAWDPSSPRKVVVRDYNTLTFTRFVRCPWKTTDCRLKRLHHVRLSSGPTETERKPSRIEILRRGQSRKNWTLLLRAAPHFRAHRGKCQSQKPPMHRGNTLPASGSRSRFRDRCNPFP